MSCRLHWTVGMALVFSMRTALAQSSDPAGTSPASPAAPAPPASAGTERTIFVAQPPLPPLEPRKRRFHDGFYLRLSLGAGYLHVTSSEDRTNFSAATHGGGMALDLLMGGTPAPGLVVGGGVLLQEAFAPKYGSGAGTSGALGFGMLGPMIDVFPNPTGGFHLGALAGVSELGLKDHSGDRKAGFGLAAWIGYMWWASSEWSVGGLVKASAGWSKRTVGDGAASVDVADAARTFTFMLSTAYH